MLTNPSLPPIRTVGELLRRLGDVPPDRVRFHPIPGQATIDDLLKPENKRCELVDHTLVEKAMGFRESILASCLIELLRPFVRSHKLGLISGEQGTYELSGLVRIPDVAFVSWERLPGRKIPEEPIPDVVPDLAIEVWSKTNTVAEMHRKRRDYFEAGVRLVWEVQPHVRRVRVYSGIDEFRELTAADTLTGDPVLPGFSLPIADLFAELDQHG